MISLNNIATADAYTPANTIAQAETMRVNLYISTAAIFWSWAKRGESFHPEEFLIPSSYSFDLDDIERVRVRSAVAGVPARVTVTLKSKADLPS